MADPTPARSNLALRLLTAAFWAPLLLWTLFLGPHWSFPALAGLICALGGQELFAMVAPQHAVTRAFGLLATIATYVVTMLGLSATQQTGFLIALVCGAMLVNLIKVEPMEKAAARMGWSIAGPLYVGGLFGVIAALFQKPQGGEWVVLAMLCGFWSDTGGYFVGRAYGKRKFYEAVSPKKTWEGSLGGIAAAMVGGLIAHFWFLPKLPLVHALLLSIAAAAAGQLGDLCESVLKRSEGVKDSGTILPGHGGILDRVDALLFANAVVWTYVTLLGH